MYRIIPPLEAKQSLQTTHLQEVRFNFLWSITATSCYSGLVVGTPATGLLVLSSNPYWCRWAVCRPTLPDMDINVDKYPLLWGKILRVSKAVCVVLELSSQPKPRLHMPRWAKPCQKILPVVEYIGIMWSVCRLCAKYDHAVYSQWKCCIVG